MVEDRITDGRRIGELLASELTGLAVDPLDDVAVESVDRDAEPAPDGRFAYDVVAGDRTIGSVYLYRDAACVRFAGDPALDVPDDLLPPPDGRDDGSALWIDRGAAVKRAVDVLAEVLAATDD